MRIYSDAYAAFVIIAQQWPNVTFWAMVRATKQEQAEIERYRMRRPARDLREEDMDRG